MSNFIGIVMVDFKPLNLKICFVRHVTSCWCDVGLELLSQDKLDGTETSRDNDVYRRMFNIWLMTDPWLEFLNALKSCDVKLAQVVAELGNIFFGKCNKI